MDGTIFVTESGIPAMRWFDPQSLIALPTRLYVIKGCEIVVFVG